MSRVLIIEDNPVNLELVVGILDSAGYEFVTAETAECGLQAARMERPDVVVLDVHLPGVSGYDVARRLKADPMTAAIPIVVLTAQAMPGEALRARAAGCDAFLTKPVDAPLLRQIVRRLLAGRRDEVP